MNKVVYVEAFFQPVGITKTVKEPTGDKTKNIWGNERDVMAKFKKWEQTGWSDCLIDGKRLAADIEKAVQSLNSEGYEVVSVTMITSGSHKWDAVLRQQSGYGYGYGYSFTEGSVIVAKKSST